MSVGVKSPEKTNWTVIAPKRCSTPTLSEFSYPPQNPVSWLILSDNSCRSDVQRCLETHMFDGQFAMKVSRWHELCDPRISTTVTTPHTPTITTTYDMNACFRLEQSCRSADYETNKCSMTWMPSSSLSYVSCICQPPIYSLFSECQYNGNVSCKRTTADESNIMGYSVCSYFWSGSVGLPLHPGLDAGRTLGS